MLCLLLEVITIDSFKIKFNETNMKENKTTKNNLAYLYDIFNFKNFHPNRAGTELRLDYSHTKLF